MSYEIVKVQKALYPAEAPMLIYDQSRDRMAHQQDPHVREFLGEAPKAFMWAEWRPSKGRWKVDVKRGFAPWQEW